MNREHNFTCPQCEDQYSLAVQALVWVTIFPNGTDADGDNNPDYDRVWGRDSAAFCQACGWHGQVGQL